jgi:hypothetical protein
MNPPVKRGLNTQDSVGAKKKRKRKHRQEQGDHLDMDTSLNTSISLMDAGLLSDYFARMITRSGTNLSSVELGDLSLPGMSTHSKDTLHPSWFFGLCLA